MLTARRIAEQIVRREGSQFTNDPADRGGQTKFGVTLETAQRFGLDVDGDGDVDADDIRKLKREDAIQLFLKEYYHAPKIHDLLPRLANSGAQLRASVMDQAVHSGPDRSIRLLQQLCVLCEVDVKIDGVVGMRTVLALDQLADRAGVELLCDAYAIERRNRYLRIALKDRSQVKYVVRRDGGKGGWPRRAEEFMRQRYRYTDAEWRDVRGSLGWKRDQ